MTRTAEQVVAALDLSGQTVVITGAISGIGWESARVLAGAGARVLLCGRGAERLAEAADRIRAEQPGAALEQVELDLADLESVRRAADEIAGLTERVDVLLNNAGVMFTPLQRTAQGHELQFGTNHLGHFLLTRQLMPLLSGRVVTVSSAGHALADIDLDDVDWRRREYDKFAAYGASKTANLLFTVELDRRLVAGGVEGEGARARAFAVHPGTIATDLARHMSREDFAEMSRLAAQARGEGDPGVPMKVLTVEEGAATSVWAATSPELNGRGGRYLADCTVSDAARPYAVDPVRAERLWELSEELVG